MPRILIIGQGIAGSVLARVLFIQGIDVTVADGNLPGASSPVAAGIINPVTGKRLALSWRFAECYPAAESFFRQEESLLHISCWYSFPMIRILGSVRESNEWTARSGHTPFDRYLEDLDNAGDWQGLAAPGLHYGLVRNAGRVDFPVYLNAVRAWAKSEGRWREETVLADHYPALLDEFDFIITCEGFRARENPYFSYLPWNPSKGEALIVRFLNTSSIETGQILKKKLLVAPLGQGLFWIGSQYDHHFSDLDPTPNGKNWIVEQMQETFTAPYAIEGHVAGIRPTVRDRRPFLGMSAENPSVGIFNGLGTKGALLAPYWAQHFANHLINGTTLDPEVNIQRILR